MTSQTAGHSHRTRPEVTDHVTRTADGLRTMTRRLSLDRPDFYNQSDRVPLFVCLLTGLQRVASAPFPEEISFCLSPILTPEFQPSFYGRRYWRMRRRHQLTGGHSRFLPTPALWAVSVENMAPACVPPAPLI